MPSMLKQATPTTTAMASDPPVIVVEHVWKGYRPQAQQISLRHEATKAVKRWVGRDQIHATHPFWALQDVSFSVQPGESVALVGRNGSGKSTLFRVLCGITRPTRGQASVRGRFATLIALGAGFNHDRTGRENIYLNAAIQGVDLRRIATVIDDIIAFSEIADFIDVPVKRYSSGMAARLGFAIAAHIFPDIIFIDEVLAVGDVAFQEKCAERILAMKDQGRTIMFVSHDPGSVRRICTRAICLHQGRVVSDGPADQVLERYEVMLQGIAAKPDGKEW